MGNGMRAPVEAIGNFDLILPSSLIIVLDNCHFAPFVTRGVVLISSLVNKDYFHTFMNYVIPVLKDNVFYFNAIPQDGIYKIDMHNLYPNVSYMFNVSNKRVKYSLDSSYLWHCRLGNINKKRMDKLERDGVLQLTHDESLEKCKSCTFWEDHAVNKRRNRTLLDMVRSMMNITTLPKSFGGYALQSAVRILNMVLTKKVDVSLCSLPGQDVASLVSMVSVTPPDTITTVCHQPAEPPSTLSSSPHHHHLHTTSTSTLRPPP
nr:hypothetical protein [Tanacetum cinerariifolium]